MCISPKIDFWICVKGKGPKRMEGLRAAIEKNPFRNECFTPYTKETARGLVLKEMLWGGNVRPLTPSRLTTAWLTLEDPLMTMAGSGYKSSEVRDKSFALQEEAANNFRGNRKYTKARVQESLAALKPTEEQMKTVAAVLYSLKRVQTVCFDQEGKTLWTMPEDLRAWSTGMTTLWVDSKCENMLEFEGSGPRLGAWLGEREAEGWVIPWPVSEGSLEDMKVKMSEEFTDIVVKAADGKKAKKDDYARTLGRCEAVRHLMI